MVDSGVKNADHLFITDIPLNIFTTIEPICLNHDKLQSNSLFRVAVISLCAVPDVYNIESSVYLDTQAYE